MRTKHELLTPAKLLRIQWRALWAMVYVFGKSMTLAQKFDPRRAAEKAEALEVWCRLALFTLIAQTAALEPVSKADKKEIEHLRLIAAALAMVMMLCARVKRQCAKRMGFAALADQTGVRQIVSSHRPSFSQPSSCLQALPLSYFDSS